MTEEIAIHTEYLIDKYLLLLKNRITECMNHATKVIR